VDDTVCNNSAVTFNIVNPNTVSGEWKYDIAVTYPAGVTGTLGNRLGEVSLVQVDNLVNSTQDLQVVEYRFTSKIDPGDGGVECIGRDTVIRVYKSNIKHKSDGG